jgi:hypothetical protein
MLAARGLGGSVIRLLLRSLPLLNQHERRIHCKPHLCAHMSYRFDDFRSEYPFRTSQIQSCLYSDIEFFGRLCPDLTSIFREPCHKS